MSYYRGEIKCGHCGQVYALRSEMLPFTYWLCYVKLPSGARCWTMWKNRTPK